MPFVNTMSGAGHLKRWLEQEPWATVWSVLVDKLSWLVPTVSWSKPMEACSSVTARITVFCPSACLGNREAQGGVPTIYPA